jgi:hypothetical protein
MSSGLSAFRPFVNNFSQMLHQLNGALTQKWYSMGIASHIFIMEITMPQSQQDDIFDELSTFCESTYICLVLTAMKRCLSEEETYLLHRSADIAGRLNPACAAQRFWHSPASEAPPRQLAEHSVLRERIDPV